MSAALYPSGTSRLVFILAHPADHVGAPAHYTPHFAACGLDWHMVPLDVAPDRLVETIKTLAGSKSVLGFNVTIPHKQAVCALCDTLGDAATFIGAVNTVRIDADGRLAGDSFDGVGFLDAARHHGLLDPSRRCVVIGTGGAGRAICHALAAGGVTRMSVMDRNRPLAAGLAADLSRRFSDLDVRVDEATDDAGLVVNATPLGLHAGDPSPIPVDTLPGDCAVFDIIASRRTALMDAAAARGLRVLGGVPMITHQLQPQTDFWLGRALQGS